MKPTDFLLCMIDATGGKIRGRTLLQKRAFFVTELLGDDYNLKFDAHYYGPYSATVEGTVTQLKNLGFLEEASTGFGMLSDGFEVRRYDYYLTEDGQQLLQKLRGSQDYEKIKRATERILSAGDPNYVELSIAAKAYFLLKRKEGKRMSVAELSRQAEHYKWSISPESIKRATSFLTSVGLVSEAS
jgi:uncharacterized protein YwgA